MITQMIFTDVLIAAGVDAEWWCEEGQFLVPSAETVGGSADVRAHLHYQNRYRAISLLTCKGYKHHDTDIKDWLNDVFTDCEIGYKVKSVHLLPTTENENAI